MSYTLFDPIKLGNLDLANRIVMAPMTRNRAMEDGTPTEAMVRYYEQRSSVGLIISEGTMPSANSKAYEDIPGCFKQEHKVAWSRVTKAVHDRGGHIFMQIMHGGRVAHSTMLPSGDHPLSPSAIQAKGTVFTRNGEEDFEVPTEMSTSNIEQTKKDFVLCAELAIEAGFDGIELHAANGYLLHQFMASNVNHRSDSYGGTPSNRARFVLEVAEKISNSIGANRVGIRISPNGTFNDIHEANLESTYRALLRGLAPMGLAYLHLIELPGFDSAKWARANWNGTLIVNTDETQVDKIDPALAAMNSGQADMVSFGRLLLANPDFVERLKRNHLIFNVPDEESFYGGGDHGYIDYPFIP